MRIVEQDQGHVNEMLALAEEFSSKTYKYSDAQSLAMYMETSPSANSSALGTVTLKDTFTQLTWGSLGVERTGEAYTKLKELSGNLANVEIATHVTAKDGEKTETYEVTENGFTNAPPIPLIVSNTFCKVLSPACCPYSHETLFRTYPKIT